VFLCVLCGEICISAAAYTDSKSADIFNDECNRSKPVSIKETEEAAKTSARVFSMAAAAF